MTPPEKIRNFSIISHVDHGKSTLADRMLELTHSIDDRNMKDQLLDSMDLERERGITIKMQPVRMAYEVNQPPILDNTEFILNLIDTPGHIDFSYEVSRALKAVEGAILLVDATQGVQAQTLTTLELAKELDLVILPVLSKTDSPLARPDEVKLELSELFGCSPDEVSETSGKTGAGVEALLRRVITQVPPPAQGGEPLQALVFDFEYSSHRGVIVFVRLFSGQLRSGDKARFRVAGASFTANEVGVFSPAFRPTESLAAGEIGYIVTGIKEPGVASVGDTVTAETRAAEPLPGYQNPAPVVWASVFPESQDDFDYLKRSLERLQLEDSSLSFNEENSQILGRGFRCGFLGMLHLEIITERLRREFDLALVITTPSTTYRVVYSDGQEELIYTPSAFPEDRQMIRVFEPVAEVTVITPPAMIGAVSQVLYQHEAEITSSDNFGDQRASLLSRMPLRELMRGFFDEIKKATAGYASVSYELSDMEEADVVRLEVLLAEEEVPALTRVTSRAKVEYEARQLVEQLHELLPRQMFATKIQARAAGRIIASKTLPAMRKDVTAKLYGGDITRKMKLREKQKEGKKRLKQGGRVNIPHEVFLKILRQRSSE